MIHQLDGNLSIRSTDFQKRITTKSFKNRRECVSYVKEILFQLDPEDTCQLTMTIQQDKFEVSYVTPVTTNFLAGSLKIAKRWHGDSGNI